MCFPVFGNAAVLLSLCTEYKCLVTSELSTGIFLGDITPLGERGITERSGSGSHLVLLNLRGWGGAVYEGGGGGVGERAV